MIHEVSTEIGGKTLTLQTGRVAKQANGAIFATYEGAAVLATVCCSSATNEDLDFIPLQVEYNEKYYAAGKIPGGFLKREARPKDKEILVSRLIDRPMRPLFYKNFMREIQLIPTTISTDQINPPDIVAMCATSACVTISDIPFDGPVAAVRVALCDDDFIINPTFEEIECSLLELIISGTTHGITMVEGGAKEISEEKILEAISFAHPVISQLCDLQNELAKKCGKEKLPLVEVPDFILADEIKTFAREKMEKACYVKGKHERSLAIKAVIEETFTHFQGKVEENAEKNIYSSLDELEQEIVRKNIIEKKVRTDGRGPSDIRDIDCAITILPRTHGTALFTRGETQALATVTLGTASDEQIRDDIDGDKKEHFLLHYNFPPYSVGETGRLFTGRREIGHGHLAFRAVQPILPDKSVFSYTIRIVSEILESNGSSSMATVCASSLSLMDSGVPIKNAVAGIAMGLIAEDDKTVVLSDILGEEDHLGDMDFKVAGTKNGITAFQMDIKIKNVSTETMKEALEQAREGRIHILQIMNKTIENSKEKLSQYAPRVITFEVDPENIGTLIGSGGKTIRSISEKYDVQVDIADNGKITLYSKKADAAILAKDEFLHLLEEPEVGKIYTGVVKRITDFGAFIEVLPGKEGLCHISRISTERVQNVKDVLSLEQEVQVIIIEIDRIGRINLSMNLNAKSEDSSQSSRGGRNHSHDTRSHRPSHRNSFQDKRRHSSQRHNRRS